MSQKYFKVKTGVSTPLVSFTNSVNSNIQISYLDSNTLSFSGTSGQLFSITDSMTGTIFAVNDISGVPSIEVDDTGVIRFAETFGNVLIGTANNLSNTKLYINGSLGLTGAINANSSVGTAGQVLTSNGSIAYWSTTADANLVQSNLTTLTTSVNTIKANVDSVQSNVSAILSGTSTINNLSITGSLSANASIGTAGQVLTSNGSIAYWATPSGGGATNLTYSADGSTVTISSDTGTDATILAANSTAAGVMTTGIQTIAGAKTFSGEVTLDSYSSINDRFSVIDAQSFPSGYISTGGDGSLGIYSQYSIGASSSLGQVVGTFSLASLYTGAYSHSNSTDGDLIGIYSYAQGTGGAGTYISKVIGVQSRVEEGTSGKFLEGIGFNSIYYGNIDTYYGFKQNALEFGTANTAYGFHSNITANSNAFNFYAASTAKNYFAGNVGIGDTAPAYKLSVNGTLLVSGDTTLSNIALSGGISANSSFGTAGQVLTSNGSVAYWSTPASSGGGSTGFEQIFLLMGA